MVEALYRGRAMICNTRMSEGTHLHRQHGLAGPIGHVAHKLMMYDHVVRLGEFTIGASQECDIGKSTLS